MNVCQWTNWMPFKLSWNVYYHRWRYDIGRWKLNTIFWKIVSIKRKKMRIRRRPVHRVWVAVVNENAMTKNHRRKSRAATVIRSIQKSKVPAHRIHQPTIIIISSSNISTSSTQRTVVQMTFCHIQIWTYRLIRSTQTTIKNYCCRKMMCRINFGCRLNRTACRSHMRTSNYWTI